MKEPIISDLKEPIISDLKCITEEMILCLEEWLRDKIYDHCPFIHKKCRDGCYLLFDNLKSGCPCHVFGQDSTIMAFTIICDMWRSDNKKRKK